MVKGKSSTNVIFSEEQFKNIKEIILENVLKVLLEILNNIFPVIMDKVSDTIKTNIEEYFPISCLTNNCDNNAKGYLLYKTITSQNVSSELQVKNFFIL